MMVMPANNGHNKVHYWAGRYGFLGHLYSPGAQRGPFPHLPYALDNGAFGAFKNETAWDSEAWLDLLKWAKGNDQKPLWAAVPDVVGDAQETLESWYRWSPVVRSYGFKAALCAQDGMTDEQIRGCGADVLFIGGGTDWKWANLYRLCELHDWVHVGRVNGYRGLARCYDAGAKSCDGTGWFRGRKEQLAGLERYLGEVAEGVVPSLAGQPGQGAMWR